MKLNKQADVRTRRKKDKDKDLYLNLVNQGGIPILFPTKSL